MKVEIGAAGERKKDVLDIGISSYHAIPTPADIQIITFVTSSQTHTPNIRTSAHSTSQSSPTVPSP